jgi:type IV secretion system protein VirB5
MSVRMHFVSSVLALTACFAAESAAAQIPVTDIGAIAQLVSELETLQQQVQTARQQLAQAQSAYQAMTGGRGMERLLMGTVRNYLPSDWSDIQGALNAGNTAFPGLSNALQQAISANAVLSDAQLAFLSPADRQTLQVERQSAAVGQVLAQQALAVTSGRFASLQQLIDAIPGATDEKGILDLQARIGAEQNMLQNEQAKLALLWQAAQAEAAADRLRAREQALAGLGRFAARFQPVP